MKPPPETTDSEHTLAWWRCPGLVYFLGAGDPPKAIKIGMLAQTGSSTLRGSMVRRLTKIQTSNHETVVILGVIPFTEGPYPTRSADARERELHIQFAHLERFKAGTCGAEWFNVAPDLLAFIEHEAKRPESLGLPRVVCAPKGTEPTEAPQGTPGDGPRPAGSARA